MSSIIILGKSPAREYRWLLRAGQHASVGRSPWAEFCIEDDARLLDFHCHLRHEVDETVTVTACEPASIESDHQWHATAPDREQLQVLAGETCLRLTRQRRPGNTLRAAQPVDGACLVTSEATEHALSTQLLQEIGLSTKALALIDQRKPTLQTLRMLVDSGLFDDALRYLAAVLEQPKRQRWCHSQLSSASIALTEDVGSLARRWLDHPSEALRQAIVTHLDWNRKQDPCTWLLASIGWTGGSLSSVSSVCVPPTDSMVITAVITAMNLAAAQCELDSFRIRAIEAGQQYLMDQVSLKE